MKKMFKALILLPVVAIMFSSCTGGYGKKVAIAGSKGEVYYKGDGVTELDAQKIGNYLKTDLKYFDDVTVKSVQLLKATSGGYDVRFVIDEKKLKEIPNAEAGFQAYAAAMSIDLYNNQPVNVFLADENMKDLKSLPYDKKIADAMIEKLKPTVGAGEDLSSYDHDNAGGVQFYWKGIPDNESKTIADYIVKNGAFAGGTAQIYMTKEGDKYLLRFPVKPESRTSPEYLAEVEKVVKAIKENVFANAPYSFSVTDEYLVPSKTWDL